MSGNFYNAAFELLDKKSSKIQNKKAFVDDKGSITYLKLRQKVQNLSFNLLKSGLKKNDRVIICMYDSIDFPISFLGAIWSGIIPICINTMLTKNEMKYMLVDSEAKAVICSEELLETFISITEKKKKTYTPFFKVI